MNIKNGQLFLFFCSTTLPDLSLLEGMSNVTTF